MAVLASADGEVGRLTLNRPEAMNAVTVQLATELEAGLRDLADSTRVIVIRGAGGNFSVGGDVDEVQRLRAEGPAALAELFASFGRALAAIAELPVPVVAAVEGHALAGGFELMQACDLAVVAQDARLGDHHARFGMVPGGGGSQRLPRLAGRQRALGLLLTGDRLTAEAAVQWGLAYAAPPPQAFEATVDALAGVLAEADPAATATTKRLVYEGLSAPLAEGLALERRAVVNHLFADDALDRFRTLKEA